MVEERRKRPRDEDSDEEDPLSRNDPDRGEFGGRFQHGVPDAGEDVEPKRPRSTRRCAQNRKPITEEPTDSEEEEVPLPEAEEEVEEEEDAEEDEEEEEEEEEYNSDDFQEEAGEEDE
ncbi:serine/threonine-protein kinase, putative [Babesia caballi]|uniref:Serine/threonine-protein kinase, putative n=1 Tax=Babesia caballi TaxID=5871 RepID=A0AAV4LNN3_BABCB|nr:serine/threonine-protein kinase, putative [Babesia caballi]